MQNLITGIQKTIGLSSEIQIKFFTSIIIILILWFLRTLAIKLVWFRTENVRISYNRRKILRYITITLGILSVTRVWFVGFQSITTFLGLLTAGIAIALRDLIANIAGWIFIIWGKPFSTGDRIQIGNHAGDIIYIRVFQFTILEIDN
jgi:small-conductance mechanosensitive channel